MFGKGVDSQSKMVLKSDRLTYLIGLASEVTAAYVSNNTARSDEVSHLLSQVYRTLLGLEREGGTQNSDLKPAVPIADSVKPDYVICLEDGKKLKMLKRHLRTVYNLTPEGYREKWRLPADYPMVAPSYARKRSDLAKVYGLGQTFARMASPISQQKPEL